MARVAGDPFAAPVVVCNEDYRSQVAEQFREIGADVHSIVLELAARNTAPAIAAASLIIGEKAPDTVTLVLPSDHVIENVGAFRKAVRDAEGAAREGYLVTFGVTPDRAEMGYGYIRAGAPLAGHEHCRGVGEFRQKPRSELAETFLASGDYLWNSGIFLFRAERMIVEVAKHHPKLLEQCRDAVAAGQ